MELAREACKFPLDKKCFEPVIEQGDARHLEKVESDSVDLVVTHPPYLNIIRYGKKTTDGDLSAISNLAKFCNDIEKVARECFRVLKPGKY